MPDPSSDPQFKAVAGDVKGKATALKKHPAPAKEAKAAQAAAQPPAADQAAQAKAAQADKMAAAKPKGFDKAAFIAAVKKAIADAAPKNLDEADKFAESGKADAIKSQVMAKVSKGKDDSGKEVAEKTKEPPDPSVAKEKAVVPLAEEKVARPGDPKAAKAMPEKAPAEQLDLRAGPCEVDTKMKDAEVTEEHLEKSNEPQFQDAAKAKQESDAHAKEAPAEVRKEEGQVLASARSDADAEAKGKVQSMFEAKGRALGKSGQSKGQAKAKDEAERVRVTSEINRIYDATKSEVEQILGDLDGKVATAFEQGEAEAKAAFTAKHKADMERYKDERYSGALGWARWTEDLFAGLPAEANQIFDRARALYESKMETVISKVADLVGAELTRAKDRIELGRKQIKDFVAKQPKDLQKVAQDAAKEIEGRFGELESDVDAKQEALVSDLAQKYVEARNKVDEEIKAEQEKNKGLVAKAMDAIGGAIEAVLKLKDLFLSMLAKAASVFTKILADPITFIGNFMNAVKQGFMNFAANIWDHLKKGLMGWLFGALAAAGIELPDSFDLKGILKLVLSILGLTWVNLRTRILKLVPAPVLDFLESKVEVFVILVREGVGGLWKWIVEKVGDLASMVLGPIKEFVVEKIVKAGITWVLGMLNPAGALIKIIQALVSVVQWIVERGAQLVEFVGTVIDGVVDIAKGGIGGVPAKIEAALGKAVPLVISFLASLLGLGGISEKIRSVIETVQKPVSKAIDAVVKGALKAAGPLIRAFSKGKAWVKGKIEKGKAWVKGKARALAGVFGIRRGFSVRGESHSVYTTGSNGRLVVASTPAPLENHPDPAVRAAYERYLAAIAATQDVGEKQRAAEAPLARLLAVLKEYMEKTGSAVEIDAKAIAAEVTRRSRTEIDPDLDADVERAFAEYNGPAADPEFPTVRKPTDRTEKNQAREEFGNLRGESVDAATGARGTGYAGVLGVARGGQVHHAIELQALSLYPGVFTGKELNALANMRGITPEGVPAGEVDKVTDAVKQEMERKRQLHNSKIREAWNVQYNNLDREIAARGLVRGTPEYRAFVRRYLESARDQIDYIYGQFFSEYRATLEWKLGMLPKDAATIKRA